MYKIHADSVLIYDSTLEDYKIGKGEVTLEQDKSGSFVFSLYPDHFYYDRFVPLKTVITVRKDNRIIFRGRILNAVTDYWNNKVITCEGELGFLQDSIVRPYVYSGELDVLFYQYINIHNTQVDDFKQFKVGTVTVVDPNGYVARSNTAYESTLDNMNTRLLEDATGGHLYTTHGDDGTEEIPTLHYLADFTGTASQTIEFGSNLRDYTKTVAAEEVATAIIPLGATVDDGNGETEDPKLTIAYVNGGLDYVYSPKGVEMYGWIFKTVEWDDVHDPNLLKSKAEAYLETIVNPPLTIELTALDLHLLDRSIDSFKVCEYVRVISKPHGIDTTMLCTKQTLDLLKPENDTIILGQTYASFTRSSNKVFSTMAHKMNNQITTINKTINSLSVKVVESDDTNLKPGIYQVYGEVDSLSINLVPVDNDLANEYCFEFIPSASFTGLTISPEIKWVNASQFIAGKVHQVSIVRGVGVIFSA